MSKLAQAIAKMEGYGVSGAIPTVRNNPGDLRHSPHSSHEGQGPNDIGVIDSAADGWADLERQLQLFADRGLTVEQAIAIFAPPSENDTTRYTKYVCEELHCMPWMLVSDALKVGEA